jgi:hypothetical protein
MRFQMKGFTSLLLMLAFLGLGISGVILYVTPRGRLTNWTGWTMLGLEKQGWQSLHMNFALVFLIVAALHVYFNWRMLWGYIKKQASLSINLKLETLTALLIAGLVLVGTIEGISPFERLLALNERIKDYWEQKPATAPMPHAEELSVAELADTMGLDLDAVMGALREKGISVDDPSQKVAEVARQNSRRPSDLYAVIKARFPEARQPAREPGLGVGKSSGKGSGRKGGGLGYGKKRGLHSESPTP